MRERVGMSAHKATCMVLACAGDIVNETAEAGSWDQNGRALPARRESGAPHALVRVIVGHRINFSPFYCLLPFASLSAPADEGGKVLAVGTRRTSSSRRGCMQAARSGRPSALHSRTNCFIVLRIFSVREAVGAARRETQADRSSTHSHDVSADLPRPHHHWGDGGGQFHAKFPHSWRQLA